MVASYATTYPASHLLDSYQQSVEQICPSDDARILSPDQHHIVFDDSVIILVRLFHLPYYRAKIGAGTLDNNWAVTILVGVGGLVGLQYITEKAVGIQQ